jgi:hypothetical protein
VTLEDKSGFTVGLGIVSEVQEEKVRMITPVNSLQSLDALRLGNLVVAPGTYKDRYLPVKTL